MSAALQRERRATAGKRMAPLVGQAMDDDDAFWGHETWKEDDEEGEGSFHESDASVHNDEFDSDFDESETDNEQEEEEAGQDEDDQLHQQEKRHQQQATTQRYVDIAKAGRDLMQKKKGKGRKRIMGDGINAGIVLNMPMAPMMPQPTFNDHHQQSPAAPLQQSYATTTTTLPPPPPTSTTTSTTATSTSTTASLPLAPPAKSPTKLSSSSSSPTVAKSRPRRVAAPLPPRQRPRLRGVVPEDPPSSSSHAATTTNTAKTSSPFKLPITSTTSSQTTNTTFTRKPNREHFTQEQLLLEAVHETEPDNERWLLARRRGQESSLSQDKSSQNNNNNSNKNLIVRFHSRRGCRDTLTFADMDAVPEILTRKRNHSHLPPATNHTKQALPAQDPSICVVTGLTARYRDPKTNLGYHNAEAFAELRRRWQQQQTELQQQTVATSASLPAPATSTTTAVPPNSSSSAAAATNNDNDNSHKTNNGLAKTSTKSVAKTAKPTPAIVTAAAAATSKTTKSSARPTTTTTSSSGNVSPATSSSLARPTNGSNDTTAAGKSTTTLSHPTNHISDPILQPAAAKTSVPALTKLDTSAPSTNSTIMVVAPLTPRAAPTAISSSPSVSLRQQQRQPSSRHSSFDASPRHQTASNGNAPATPTSLRSPSTRKRKPTPKAMETTMPIPSLIATYHNRDDDNPLLLSLEDQPTPSNLLPRLTTDAALVTTSSHNNNVSTESLQLDTSKTSVNAPSTVPAPSPFMAQPLVQNTMLPAFPMPLATATSTATTTTPTASSADPHQEQQLKQQQHSSSASSLEQQQQQQGASLDPVHLRHGGEIGNQVAKRSRR